MDVFEKILLTGIVGFGLLWCGSMLSYYRNIELHNKNQVTILVGLVNILVEMKLLDADQAIKALADRYGIKLQHVKPKDNANIETPSNRK